MLPTFSMDNLIDASLRDAVFAAQCGLRDSACRISGADGPDLFGRELGNRMADPARQPLFLGCVREVVAVRTEEQVVRVHTGGVIPTRAVVADLGAFGNRSSVHLPRQPMGVHFTPLTVRVGAGKKLTMSANEGAYPEPAALRLADMSPESLMRRRGAARLERIPALLRAKASFAFGEVGVGRKEGRATAGALMGFFGTIVGHRSFFLRCRGRAVRAAPATYRFIRNEADSYQRADAGILGQRVWR